MAGDSRVDSGKAKARELLLFEWLCMPMFDNIFN